MLENFEISILNKRMVAMETVYRVNGEIFETVEEAREHEQQCDTYEEIVALIGVFSYGEMYLNEDALRKAINNGTLVYKKGG